MVYLGEEPIDIDVKLNRHADFNAVMRRQSGAWDVGTQIELHFGNVVWAATIDGDTATWAKDKVDVDALISTKVTSVRTRYTVGTADILWGVGVVRVYG